jgi:hypothetical protein
METAEKFLKNSSSHRTKMEISFALVYPVYKTDQVAMIIQLSGKDKELKTLLTKKEAEQLANELLKIAAYLT